MRKIVTILVAINFSCSQTLDTPKDVIETNLEITSKNRSWSEIQSMFKGIDQTVFIGGNQKRKLRKELSLELPDKLLEREYSNDTLNIVAVNESEWTVMIKFDNGKPQGYSKVVKTEPIINPVLDINKKVKNLILKDSLWNGVPSYMIIDTTESEEFFFHKESLLLLAKTENQRYGKTVTTYDDYEWRQDFLIPVSEEYEIPKIRYKTQSRILEFEANPEFVSGYFSIKEEWLGLQPGDKIPDFRVSLIDDPYESVSSEDLIGKVVLVDFWATWCKPCLEELPNLKKNYARFANKGFEILSISIDNEEERLVDYVERSPFPWKYNAYDSGGFNSEIADVFQLIAIPKPILIDPSGQVVAVDMEARGENLTQRLEEFFERDYDFTIE